jgi:DNA-directed RNA polymerase subunit E'/Rpb7|uniref:S1 motif domain-containing protein n=1 Tax=viral metagenome TaxID=1070528 RepID=A0A6C0IYZ2_9ZZZZ
MQSMIISKRITLKPVKLTNKFKKHIIKQLETETDEECSKLYGYILKIHSIEKITCYEDTILLVDFLADTLKPEVGQEIKATVFKIYKDGLFVDILDKQKILVPSVNINDYEFNEENDTYIHTKDSNKVIKENDPVKVRIDAVKYNNAKFSCFGSLV